MLPIHHHLKKKANKEPTAENEETLSSVALLRIRKDIMHIQQDTPPGIFVYADDQSIKRVHAVIKGVEGTPYAGGFFYFIVDFPNTYPIQPPTVRFMTTAAGRVRFNPNLYKNGKVCLSILNTWAGPQWSPAQHLGSVLISIQSLLNERPYLNEPGTTINENLMKKYNRYIRYVTLEIAVVSMLDNDHKLNLPDELMESIEKEFLNNYETYVKLATDPVLEGKSVADVFNKDSLTCNLKHVRERLEKIHTRLREKHSKPFVRREMSELCKGEAVTISDNESDFELSDLSDESLLDEEDEEEEAANEITQNSQVQIDSTV